jgi:hypothetical protein
MSRRIESVTPLQRLWWRAALLLAVLTWLVIGLLGHFGRFDQSLPIWSGRHLVLHSLLILAGLLTFLPLEQQHQLPGLTIEGTIGIWFGGIVIVLVPAPQGPLYDPVDLPLYLALLPAVTLTAAACSRPLVTAISSRLFAQRSWAFDPRRIRRQSFLIGLLTASTVVLGGLRLLTWLNMVLLLLVALLIELVFLALVRTADSD